MKKLYVLFLMLLFVVKLVGQAGKITVVPMNVEGGIQFVDKLHGKPASQISWREAGSFVNGFAKVFDGRRWGFINGAGLLAAKPVYQAVRNFSNQLAAVNRSGKWGFINEQGIPVIPCEFDIVYDFKEPVTAVYRNKKWMLIDRQGNLTKNLPVDVFYGFKNGVGKFLANGKTGLVNTKGDIVSIRQDHSATSPANPLHRGQSNLDEPCPANIDFESGDFSNWTAYTGDVRAVSGNNVVTVSPSQPLANRHDIVAASNPSVLDPYGLFPINPPDGSGFAVKLGNDINGAEAERISYQINVPANSVDASIIYRYAVVFQDPGHLTYEQPRFSAKLLDVQTNTYLPCATYEYISTSSLPGFQTSTIEDTVKFKTWASVYVNLSHYAGRSLILEFTTADCTKGGHWGYAYIDVGDCNISASVEYRCNPSQASFTAPPGFEFYNWWSSDFSTLLGTGETMLLDNPPVPGTTVHVEVIPYNGYGCSDTLDVTLVNGAPTANAGADQSICVNGSITIGSAPVPGHSYSWSPASYLNNALAASPTSSPPQTTTYKLTVTNLATGCTAEDSMLVNVNPKPIAQFDPSSPQCLAGNSFTFNNTSSVSSGSLSYAWSFGDSSYSAAPNPSHSYSMAGVYPVKLVATSNHGCKDSTTHPAVTVNANPPVKTIADRSICRGTSVPLTTTGAITYTWTPAQALNCTDCANPVASPLVSSTYYVRGVDNAGCPGYDTVHITVHQPISIDYSPDRTICAADSVTIQATGAQSYLWSPASGLSATNSATTTAYPAATTRYRVIGFDGNGCFTDTGYINITVNPKPTIELGPDLTLNTGTVHPLSSVYQNGPIANWHWSPPVDLDCITCPEPSATIRKDITYYVDVRNVHGCLASDSIHIRTICENSQVFIPNAFTPDGDGVNDVFMVRAKGIETVRSFRIFPSHP